MNGNCLDDLEFFSPKMFQYIVRAKYLIAENAALNAKLRKYIYKCQDWQIVFLGHGVAVSDDITKVSYVNIYNVSSDQEKKFIQDRITWQTVTDDNFVVGGLPRLDYI